jgi:hypothetical protein
MTAEQVPPAVELEPAKELDSLDRRPPAVEDSASVWLVWHERHIRCWDRIAAEYPFLADNAAYMVDGHRRDIKELLADPTSRRARHGYWDLWPKATD